MASDKHSQAELAAAPGGSDYVDFDEYVDIQLRKTSSTIKSTDVLTAIVGASTLLTAYLLLFVVSDHWLVPGGFGTAARVTLLSVLLVAVCAWIGWKVVWPWRRRVSGLYSASTLEKASPGFKGSLLNLVDLLHSEREIPPEVLQSIERRAAMELTHVDVQEAVDRRLLLRLSMALLAFVVLFSGYWIVSPKNPATSLWRALAPSSATPVSTRTRIYSVRPGDIDVVARSQVEVIADIRGEMPSTAALYYTTADGKFVDERIDARPTNEGSREFRFVINGDNGAGILQDQTYRVVAGDDSSANYKIHVIQPPAASIDSIRLDYPKYTKLGSVTQTTGAIDAIEGTRVTLKATANMPLRSASLQFFDDESASKRAEELPIHVTDGKKLDVEWPLAMRSDGTYPHFYRIYCTSAGGETERSPNVYSLAIRSDQQPEVVLRDPKTDLDLPANAVVPLLIEARDPDFTLRYINLKLEKDGAPITEPEIWSGHDQQVRTTYRWSLKEFHFRPGDTINYWVQAQDNRAPLANIGNSSPRLKIHITAPIPDSQAQKNLEMAERKQKDESKRNDEEQKAQQNKPEDQGDDANKPQKDRANRDAKSEQQKANSQQQDQSPEEMKQAEQAPGENAKGNDGNGEGGDNPGKNYDGGSQQAKSQKLDPDNPASDPKVLQKMHDHEKEQDKGGGGGEGEKSKSSSGSDSQSKDASSAPGEKAGEQKSQDSKTQNENSKGSQSPEGKSEGDKFSDPKSDSGKSDNGKSANQEKPGDKKDSKSREENSQSGASRKTDSANQKQPGAKSGDANKQPAEKSSAEKESAKQAAEKRDGEKPGGDQSAGQKPTDDKNKPAGSDGSKRSPEAGKQAGDKPSPDEKPQAGQKEGQAPEKNDGAKNDGQQKEGQKNDTAKNDAGKNDTGKNDAGKNDTAKNGQQSKPDQKQADPNGAGDKPDPSKNGDKEAAARDAAKGQKSEPSPGDSGSGEKNKTPGDQKDANTPPKPGDGSKPTDSATDKSSSPNKQEPNNQTGKQPGEPNDRQSAGQENASKPNASKDNAGKPNDQSGQQNAEQKKSDEKGSNGQKTSETPKSERDADGSRQSQSEAGSKPKPGKAQDERPDVNPQQAPGNEAAKKDKSSDRRSNSKDPEEQPAAADRPSNKPQAKSMRDAQQANEKGDEQSGAGKTGDTKRTSDPKSRLSQEGTDKPGAKEQTKEQNPASQKGQDRPDQSESPKPGQEKSQQQESQKEQSKSGQPQEGQKSQAGQKGEPGKQGQKGDQNQKSEQGENGQPKSGEQGKSGQKSAAGSQQQQGQGKEGGGKEGQGEGSKSSGGKQSGQQPGQAQGSGMGNNKGSGNSGGGHNEGQGSGSGESLADTRNQANLDYARKATDLLLNRLDKQLSRGQVDEKLLKELGWTKDEVKRFVDRMRRQAQAAQNTNTAADEVRRLQYLETLRSLDLKSSTKARSGAGVKKAGAPEIEARRLPPPPEFRALYEAYTKSLNRTAPPRENEKK